MRTKLPDGSDCSWLPPSCGFTHMTLIVRFTVYMFYVLCFISPKPIPQENIFVDRHQVLFVHRDHSFNSTPVVIWKRYSWIYQGLNACLALAGKGSEDPEISKAPVILCEPPSTCLASHLVPALIHASAACSAECLCLAGVKLTKLFSEDLKSHICSCSSQAEAWVWMEIHTQSEKGVKRKGWSFYDGRLSFWRALLRRYSPGEAVSLSLLKTAFRVVLTPRSRAHMLWLILVDRVQLRFLQRCQ